MSILYLAGARIAIIIYKDKAVLTVPVPFSFNVVLAFLTVMVLYSAIFIHLYFIDVLYMDADMSDRQYY